MKPDRCKVVKGSNKLSNSSTLFPRLKKAAASNPNLEISTAPSSFDIVDGKNAATRSFVDINNVVVCDQHEFDRCIGQDGKRGAQNLRNRAESDIHLDSSHSCCDRSSFSSMESKSPYKSLKKGHLKLAVLAVKERLTSKNSQRKQDAPRPLASLMSTPKSTRITRLTTCQKELDVCFRYFLDVVTKDKLLMLPGSASILLDLVVKLLLILNEKTRTDALNNNCTEQIENQKDSSLKMYDEVCFRLAEMLKIADKLVLTDRPAVSMTYKDKIVRLSNELKHILKDLINQCSLNDQLSSFSKRSSDPKNVTLIENCEIGHVCDRRSSFSSRTSVSSGGSDLCQEDIACSLLDDHQNSPSRLKMSSYSPASSKLIPEPTTKPPLPCDLLLPCPNLDSEHAMKCPSTTGSNDSGVGSFHVVDDGRPTCTGDDTLGNRILVEEPLSPYRPSIDYSLAHPVTHDSCTGPMFDIIDRPHSIICTSTPVIKVSDDVQADQEVFSEEKEEKQGDRVVKTTKITTRKVIKKTVVTTKQATILARSSMDDDNRMNGSTNLENLGVIDQLNFNDLDGAEIKFTETENFYLTHKNKGASRSSLVADKNVVASALENGSLTRDEMPGEKVDFNLKSWPILEEGGQKLILSGSHFPTEQSCPVFPAATETDYDLSRSNGVSKTLKREHSVVQQSSSVQSISRKALFNGRLLAEDKQIDAQNSLLKASKSDTFKNGILATTNGKGSIVQDSWTSKDTNCTGAYVDKDGDPEIPRISGVLSYVRIFGNSKPLDETDFRAVSLASYIQLRDKWRCHEESWRRTELNVQFGFNSGASSSSPKFDVPSPCHQSWTSVVSWAASNPNSESPFGQPRTNTPLWSDGNKGATAPRIISNKFDKDDYQNLMELLELDERLKFPHRFFDANKVEPHEKKYLSFRKQAGLTFVNYLDELDVKRFLISNNKTDVEDGPEIRGGPVDALIAYATNAGSSPKGFMYQEAFLTTYRTFVSPIDLLNKLIYRHEKFFSCTKNNESCMDSKQGEYGKAVKNTFSLIVCIVDDLSPADLTDNTLEILSNFLYRMVCSGQLNMARYLRQRLTRRIEYKQEYNASLVSVQVKHFSVPHPQIATLRHSARIIDFKSELLAEQFVYLDWCYFKKIELSEMLLWAQQQTEEHSPNLATFTAHFNKMSYWVRTKVLSHSEVKDREATFAKFLKVMHHLKQMNNFNSLFAMLSALDSGSIRRLEWPKSLSETLSQYSPLTDSSQSFKAYRHALAETKPPCLPYIGIILQDLTFVHIGNPNLLPESQCEGRKDNINLMKRWQQHTILDNMRRFKAWPYNVKKNDQILSFLNDFDDHMDEEELWRRSEIIKPRTTQTKRASNL